MENQESKALYYQDYLHLEKILNAQEPISEKMGIKADDEMLFIIIHQSYELWFKLIIHELNLVRENFKETHKTHNIPDLHQSIHRLKRICGILDVTLKQIGILETMSPIDYLDFRGLLGTASGFQGIQFKIIEASLGLDFNHRYGKDYYTSKLTPSDVEKVRLVEKEKSLLVLVNQWLEEIPFLKNAAYWQASSEPSFWKRYREAYVTTLAEAEVNYLSVFDNLFINDNKYPNGRSFSADASRSALFIMLYKDYPALHLPYELLNTLMEIDESLSMWRHRHIHLVQRTIGNKVGTGGSTGAEYLRGAADSHIIFKELPELVSFVINRKLLPKLPDKLIVDLGGTPNTGTS